MDLDPALLDPALLALSVPGSSSTPSLRLNLNEGQTQQLVEILAALRTQLLAQARTIATQDVRISELEASRVPDSFDEAAQPVGPAAGSSKDAANLPKAGPAKKRKAA